VNTISEIETLSDAQLHEIFADGTAEIPGADAKDVYQFCKGRTMINSWTQGGEQMPAPQSFFPHTFSLCSTTFRPDMPAFVKLPPFLSHS
jgi:hypothetical protein